jgi:outer membrane protein
MQRIRIVFCLILLCTFACGIQAQPPSNQRLITLQEAIQLAVENNFEVQIERYNPEIDEYRWRGQYGLYDPTLNVSAGQSKRESEGYFDQDLRLQIPGGENWSEFLRAGITGLLPTGTRYDLSATFTRTSGKFPRIIIPTDTNLPPFSVLQDLPFQNRSFAGITLTQPLLRNFLYDNARLSISLAKTQLRMSEAAFLFRLMDVINRVEQAYHNLIFARENVKVQERALELAERSLLENKKRVEVGSMAPLDEKQAESLVASSKAALIDAQRQRAAQENLLKNLITSEFPNAKAEEFVPAENLVPVVQVFDLQESWRRGLSQRPDLKQLRYDIENREIRLKYTKSQILPSLDLTGSFGINGVDENWGPSIGDLRDLNNPQYSFGVLINYPIPNRSARNNYKVSKAEKKQALLRLKQLEQDILVEIDDAIQLARSSFERVEATKQARAFAEAALDAEQKKLENGKSTSFFVLQFQRDLTTARFEEIRALAEYNNALAILAFREGATLDRHNLEVKIK